CLPKLPARPCVPILGPTPSGDPRIAEDSAPCGARLSLAPLFRLFYRLRLQKSPQSAEVQSIQVHSGLGGLGSLRGFGRLGVVLRGFEDLGDGGEAGVVDDHTEAGE